MRLHRLELAGFGPFRDRQVVDFDAFADEGIFLISGRTGAGKSSILDGASFALYGAIARYQEGGEKSLRSDHCRPDDPTEVVLEFSVDDRRFRVTRSPEYLRPSKRGDKLTKQPAHATLEEQDGGVWTGIAAGSRDVGILLDELIGLKAEQFHQVILLAQNRFSRFLLASVSERQALLRTLFGTRKYDAYANALAERAKDARAALDRSGVAVTTLVDQAVALADAHELRTEAEPWPQALTDRFAALERARERADYRADTASRHKSDADTVFAAASEAHAAATSLAALRQELDAARAEVLLAETARGQTDADRARLERARAAEAVRPLIDAERAAREGAETAAAEALRAAAVWEERGVDLGGESLATYVETLSAELTRWRDAEAVEASLTLLGAAVADAEASHAAATIDLAAIEERARRVPAELADIDKLAERAAAQAATVDALRAQHDDLLGRRAAAERVASLQTDLATTDAAYVQALAEVESAGRALQDLIHRRIAGYAGELAAHLAPGEPCAVCGSPEHPAPATRSGEPVTDEDVTAAEELRTAALERERVRARDAAAAREELSRTQATAGGATVAELAERVSACATELSVAESAAEKQTEYAAQREKLVREAESTDEARAATTARLAATADALTRARLDEQHARERVTVARGEFASVVERVAAATADLGAAERVISTTQADTLAATARAEAEAALARGVADSPFSSADEAREAMLAQSERDALAEDLSGRAARAESAKNRALDLELRIAAVPAEASDLEAAQLRLRDADAARAAAIAAERDAISLATQLRRLMIDADAHFGEVAERAAEADALTRLSDTVAGRAPNTMKMDLESFVLAAELEDIVRAANLRLDDMTSGRYSLRHTDARAARGAASGLGIEVYDAHTGATRPAQSLSGGETFLASLALALGLAEVVTSRAGGVRLDTLFIDEGFGSLDADTLELAMRTLDELRTGGRTVGVISHVEAMKEEIPARIFVETVPGQGSVIRGGAPADASA